MNKEIRSKVTDGEFAEIEAYVKSKKRWRKIGHFVRYAVFQAMERNPAGRHDLRRGADRTDMPEGNCNDIRGTS